MTRNTSLFSSESGMLAESAFAGLQAGLNTRLPANAGTQMFFMAAGANQCKGQNACKGQGGCKTGDKGCKGQNSCKGKGGCKSSGGECKGKDSCKGKSSCKS